MGLPWLATCPGKSDWLTRRSHKTYRIIFSFSTWQKLVKFFFQLSLLHSFSIFMDNFLSFFWHSTKTLFKICFSWWKLKKNPFLPLKGNFHIQQYPNPLTLHWIQFGPQSSYKILPFLLISPHIAPSPPYLDIFCAPLLWSRALIWSCWFGPVVGSCQLLNEDPVWNVFSKRPAFHDFQMTWGYWSNP